MDPTPIADWIEQHMHPVEANRPAFADSTYTKTHYYSLENSFIYLKAEDTYATVRGPGYVPSYDRYDSPGTGNFHADATVDRGAAEAGAGQAVGVPSEPSRARLGGGSGATGQGLPHRAAANLGGRRPCKKSGTRSISGWSTTDLRRRW